jgi:hypothetical protein
MPKLTIHDCPSWVCCPANWIQLQTNQSYVLQGHGFGGRQTQHLQYTVEDLLGGALAEVGSLPTACVCSYGGL